MTLLPENIEETYWTACELRVGNAEFCTSLLNESAHFSGLADAGEVSLHVGHEARDARLAECLGEDLEGDSLSGTGGSGNEAVSVGHLSANRNRTFRPMGYVQPVL